MQPSQVLVFVSVLFGIGGLLLGFLLGAAWASRRNSSGEADEAAQEPPAVEETIAPEQPVAAPAPAPQVIPAPIPAAPLSAAAGRQEQPVLVVPSAVEKPAAPANRSGSSMIEQINSILAEMTADTPLAKHNIHLAQSQHLGVSVWVDNQHYDGVDSVPDVDIRSVIQAAVRKWEEG